MTEPVYVYNPLERRTYEAIAYNAVGRGSEVNTYPAYGLVHSTGNSGWSVGLVQWDFGQPNRGHKVQPMLDGYQAWAPRKPGHPLFGKSLRPNKHLSDTTTRKASPRKATADCA